MAADDVTTKEAKASLAIVLTQFTRNTPANMVLL